jgi:hypothetical protein
MHLALYAFVEARPTATTRWWMLLPIDKPTGVAATWLTSR